MRIAIFGLAAYEVHLKTLVVDGTLILALVALSAKTGVGPLQDCEHGARDAAVVAGGGYGAVPDALIQKRQGQRGPQRRPTKTPVTVRYDPEVVAYFKATGAGWQTRMNEVLCEWVAKRGSA